MFKVFSGEEMGNLHMLILRRLAGKGSTCSFGEKADALRDSAALRSDNQVFRSTQEERL
jgi:hypothetical protein